jgi:quercetin dioxygenase-like cupin family protein
MLQHRRAVVDLRRQCGAVVVALGPKGDGSCRIGVRMSVVVPALVPAFSLVRADSAWTIGRAGMLYRDLIADRQGGRFIGSHIRIPDGGDVHHHAIRFQLIYCDRGWVRVAYEDQGAPIVMEPGDCVLQPPDIRHRVLECAAQTDVIEVACPAEYETTADPALALPTGRTLPDRDFGGQRFVFHRASESTDDDVRDLGLADATGGLVHARVIRGGDADARVHGGELLFTYVLGGEAQLECTGTHELSRGDAVVVPPGTSCRFIGDSSLRRLEVAVH